MLKPIACPSYIKTRISQEATSGIDVAQIPYDQFHSLMADVLTQNRKLVEVNTILADFASATRRNDLKALTAIFKRTALYLEES